MVGWHHQLDGHEFEQMGSEEEVPGHSVFPSGEPGVSGDFWGSQEGCQGPFHPSGQNTLP